LTATDTLFRSDRKRLSAQAKFCPAFKPTAGTSSRLATQGDEPFLFELFCAVRGADFAALDATAARQILLMQYNAQTASIRKNYPSAVELLIETAEAVPVGRFTCVEMESTFHIIDIAIVPSRRGLGIATGIISQVQKIAAAKEAAVTLCVARGNPAVGLYERLGFVDTRGDAVYRFMQWKQGPDTKMEQTKHE
jgi:ribosomal protein S18 acetylase RimI-like enzyme